MPLSVARADTWKAVEGTQTPPPWAVSAPSFITASGIVREDWQTEKISSHKSVGRQCNSPIVNVWSPPLLLRPLCEIAT